MNFNSVGFLTFWQVANDLIIMSKASKCFMRNILSQRGLIYKSRFFSPYNLTISCSNRHKYVLKYLYEIKAISVDTTFDISKSYIRVLRASPVNMILHGLYILSIKGV